MNKNQIFTATVTKAVGGVFTAYKDDKKFTLFAPKKLRYNDLDILVGDKVTFEVTAHTRGIIQSVLPRTNRLIRPEIANVDIVFIVMACLPQPDLLLIDKLIVNSIAEHIQPILVVNKCDLDGGKLFHEVVKQYDEVCKVLSVSVNSGEGVDQLRQLIKDKTVCFAGQSAVGKTSILNAILPQLNNKVGDLSTKTQRGMHTTRHSQIYPAEGGFVADTTGFSLLELSHIDSKELMLYYHEYQQYAQECKYNMCTHTVEPQCAVKQAVEQGKLSQERYQRYVRFYNQLVEKEQKKYH